MQYTLRGKIANVTPLTLDKTLSLEGASADAKAVGDAVKTVRQAAEQVAKSLSEHKEHKENPHNVTAEQLGLGEVDNTSDMDKPVSTAQATAIADAKKAGTDAQAAAEIAQTRAEEAETNAKNYGAEAANTAETNAKNYADSLHKSFTVALPASGWSEDAPFTQTVAVEGILGTDAPHWGIVYSDEVPEPEGEEDETESASVLELNLSEKEAFSLVDDLDTADGSVTFTCFEEKPAVDLTIQMEVNR